MNFHGTQKLYLAKIYKQLFTFYKNLLHNEVHNYTYKCIHDTYISSLHNIRL